MWLPNAWTSNARAERSFTEKHGDALAQRMHRLCNVANDDHLPKALRLPAKSTSKSRDCAILGNLFWERAQASVVPLTGSQPVTSGHHQVG